MSVAPSRTCAIGAVLLALFSASGARHVIPGLREATRALPAKSAPNQNRGRALVRSNALAAFVGFAIRRVARTLRPPTSRPPAPASIHAPVGAREPGSDALGVSVPRSARWAVLGGHGRNGVG